MPQHVCILAPGRTLPADASCARAHAYVGPERGREDGCLHERENVQAIPVKRHSRLAAYDPRYVELHRVVPARDRRPSVRGVHKIITSQKDYVIALHVPLLSGKKVDKQGLGQSKLREYQIWVVPKDVRRLHTLHAAVQLRCSLGRSGVVGADEDTDTEPTSFSRCNNVTHN